MSTKKKVASKKTSFAQQFEELESIVSAFDDTPLDIDVSVEQFEKGLALAEDLKKQLASVEQKIEKIQSDYKISE